MSNQLKILRFLMENKESFSINGIAKKLKLNYRIAFEEINKLQKENITIKKLGNSNQCSFNFKFNEKVLFIENQRKEELLKNKNIKVLNIRLQEIKNPFYIMLIFGSYAKNTQTKQSDLDLCIITDNNEIKQKTEQIIRTMPFEVHLLDFTTKDFINMLKTTEQNLGKEILKNNVILKNIENYYELIAYAG